MSTTATVQKCIMVHHSDGVYIGSVMGMGCFSKLDAIDQNSAVLFSSEKDAQDWVETWDDPLESWEYSCHFYEVEPDENYIDKDRIAEHW